MEEKSGNIQESKKSEMKRRQSEATSKDTVSDLEENESVSDNESGRRSKEPPSPDDGNKQRRAPDDAGPM